jgi:dipeptidase
MCDTFVRVTDEGVMFAKNSDRDANEAQALEWHAAREAPAGAELRCTWVAIPEVPMTQPTLLSRPWWLWGAEMGANASGVVIGNEAVFTTSHEDEPGLLGMDLVRLALERSTSAAAAVEVIVSLLERYGQGGPCSIERPGFSYDNSFLIADRDGAIVLETAGRHWAVEQVAAGSRAISNGLTIEPFARAHAKRLRGLVAACALRRRTTEGAAAGVEHVADAFSILRLHAHGATAPSWSMVRGGLRAPCVHSGGVVASSQTTGSLVSDLRGTPVHWATATAAPCTSVFKPFAVDDSVDLGPMPTNRADGSSVWWRHEVLHRALVAGPPAQLQRFGAEVRDLEHEWLRNRPSSAAAVGLASALEDRWVTGLEPASDARPWFVRRRTSAESIAAGLGGADPH